MLKTEREYTKRKRFNEDDKNGNGGRVLHFFAFEASGCVRGTAHRKSVLIMCAQRLKRSSLEL